MSLIKSGYIWKGTKDEFSGPKSMSLRLNKMFSSGDLVIGTNSDGYTPDDGITPSDPTGLTFSSAVEGFVISWSWTQNTPPLRTEIYESSTATRPDAPTYFVGGSQKSFSITDLPAGTTRYYWIRVEARNGRFSGYSEMLTAIVTSWPVTDSITTNLGKKITRNSNQPSDPNDGDIWINTSDNNILYKRESGNWIKYQDKRVDSIADEYVLMVTPSSGSASQRIAGMRVTNQDGGIRLASATRSGQTVTITTTADHGYTTGNTIALTDIGWTTTNPNGGFRITTTSITAFTYLLPEGTSTETYAVTNAYAAKGTQFVIQSDYFSVVNSDGGSAVAPFTIDSGTVYITDALIKNLSAAKITAGTLGAGTFIVGDSASNIIKSATYASGSTGWAITGNGNAEFNAITVRNGVVASPTITSATFTDSLVINSTLGIRRSVDTAVLTITGASANGSSYGAQIDLVGNNYNKGVSPATDYSDAGVLVLQAGSGAGSAVRLLTNQSPVTNVGVVRLSVKTDGLVTVEKNLSNTDVYTANAGNLHVAGAITVATPLAVAQGGTGANAAVNACINLLPVYTGNAGKVLVVNAGMNNVEWSAAGTGTVTSVSVVTANGFSGTATLTSTPAITLTAGDLSVSSIVVSGETVIKGRQAAVTAASTSASTSIDASTFEGDDTINLTDLADHLNAVDTVLNAHGARINDLIARLSVTAGHGLIDNS